MLQKISDFFSNSSSSQVYFWLFVAVAVIFIIAKSQEHFLEIDVDEEEKEDPELIADMENAKSAEDLMDAVGDYEPGGHEPDCLMGKENDVFLRKARELAICRHDWAEAYRFAEEGSELEKVAKEKAGSELD